MKESFGGRWLAGLVIALSLAGLAGCEIEDTTNQRLNTLEKRAKAKKKRLAQLKMERLQDLARAKRQAKAAARRAYLKAQAEVVPDNEPEPAVEECDPNYAGACLDPGAYDYDCAGGSGDGPEYTGYVQVVGSDPHDLDSDGDGVGCE